MKMAPSIRPPPKSSKNIHSAPLLPRGNRKLSTATVSRYAAGIRAVMTFRTSRYPKPTSSSSAEVSPRHPLTLPRNRSETEQSGSCPRCMEARGVAMETASAVAELAVSAALMMMSGPFSKPGAVQLVMAVGQLNMKARAARAGLTKFLPRPPKSCLTTMMAKKSPRTMVQ